MRMVYDKRMMENEKMEGLMNLLIMNRMNE